jgi:hypothetical protein
MAEKGKMVEKACTLFALSLSQALYALFTLLE